MSLHFGVSWDEYRKMPGLNPSTIVHGMESMAKLKEVMDGKVKKNSNAMSMGTATAFVVLEGEIGDAVIWPHKDRRVAGWKKFKEENVGRTILTTSEFNRVLKMAESIRANRDAMDILKQSDREVVVTGREHGVDTKGRLDCLRRSDGFLGDLKTTRSLDWFWKAAEDLHYRIKMGCYARWSGAKRAGFVVVENCDQFRCEVLPIHESELAQGWRQANRIIARYVECMNSGVWPESYPEPTFAIRRK